MNRPYRYLDVIIAFFVAVLLISNIASSAKIVQLGSLSFDGGTLLFPLSYIFSDILTEVYGYKISRRVIWIGFATTFLLSVTLAVVGALPAEGDWAHRVGDAAYASVLGSTPRIVFASLAAYWVGSFVNDIILAKLKTLTQSKWLWLRTVGSTLVGEGLDTLLFAFIAFAGVLPNSVLFAIIWSNYAFKVGIEVLFTPVTYAVVAHLKKAENADADDANTNFNPFHWSTT